MFKQKLFSVPSLFAITLFLLLVASSGCGTVGTDPEVKNDTELGTGAGGGTGTGISFKIPDTGQTKSFTNTFGEDSDYSTNLMSFTDNGDKTVTDNVTELMWEQRDDEAGQNWLDAKTYCSSLKLGEFSDWRLPNLLELVSIVNYGAFRPAINQTFFPITNPWRAYWTSSNTSQPSKAWIVEFTSGFTRDGNTSGDYLVRCVRGEELLVNYSDMGSSVKSITGCKFLK